MQRAVRIKDHWAEQRLFVGRTIVAFVVVVALLCILLGRLFWLQVVRHDHFAELSQGNRVRVEPLPPDRGLIHDRRGTVIAENTPAYQLELTPEQVPDVPGTLERLAAIGLLDRADLPQLRQLIRGSRKFESVPLRLTLSHQDIATFAVQRFDFPGVEIRTRLARWYPLGPVGVHALGYVGAISEADLKRIDRDDYVGSSQIGKIGLEFAYEDELHGVAGFQHVLVNAAGRRVASVGGEILDLDERPSRAGNDLYLGLDAEVQELAEAMLGDRRGAVVAIDPNNGDVLVLASTPTFDGNKFTRGISARDYARLRDDPDLPLLNRAVRSAYPPGSTVKPMYALAALEYGIKDPADSLYCRGVFFLPGSSHRFRDWKREGHGTVNMERAVAISCDVYFYRLAEQMGIERMHQAMTKLGFGKPTGLDIGGERAGLMPSPAWKRRQMREAWFPGETVIAGIGQGYMLATPLQLAHATAVIAARGMSFRPRLVTAIRDSTTGAKRLVPPVPETPVVLDDPKNWDIVIDGMLAVTEGGGTAAASARGAAYTIAGKTGTTQVFSIGQNEIYDESKLDERLHNHALFVAFAPAEQPKIAISVFVENGGSGSRAAAPIARRVLDAYLLRQFDWTPLPGSVRTPPAAAAPPATTAASAPANPPATAAAPST